MMILKFSHFSMLSGLGKNLISCRFPRPDCRPIIVHAVELAIAEVGEAFHGLEVGEDPLGVPTGRDDILQIDERSASRPE